MSADEDTRATAEPEEGVDVVPPDEPSVLLAVESGTVLVVAAPDASGSAQLSWPSVGVRVRVDGEEVTTTSCRVCAGSTVELTLEQVPARVRYDVQVARDRMEATLRVVPEQGIRRALCDAAPSASLQLRLDETPLDPPEPELSDASAALQRAEVVHGVDAEQVAAAVAEPGTDRVVAVGTNPIEGEDGYLEHLVDVEALRLVGVLADTQLARRVPRRDGVSGRDVTGRELKVPVVRDAKLRAGEGVRIEEAAGIAVATVDGLPKISTDGVVEVRHELVVEEVDTVTGDIAFNGSVHVTGGVHEGRSLIARDIVVIDGNVDRGHVESGGSLTVGGTIMSSVLRAGGDRAVMAAIADRVTELPRLLGLVAVQARQLRDQAAARGQELAHGLAIQLMVERVHRTVLPSLTSIADELAQAGPNHCGTHERVCRWHHALSTAANHSMTPEQFQDVLADVGSLVEDVRRAMEQPADMHVSYMQTSEAEATGTVTVTGKGIFNSRIVAHGGLDAQRFEAVLRGGSVTSNGRVHVAEVGSPAGAKTVVQLGQGASLDADRAYAGTIISGPGYTHRFEGDRTHVKVAFDTGGSMNVESLAA